MKIRKDDRVVVITGKYKGLTGAVSAVLDGEKVVVGGVNLVSRAVKPNPARQEVGGLVQKAMPLHISNVALLSANGKRCKVSWERQGDKKVRVLRERVEAGSV